MRVKSAFASTMCWIVSPFRIMRSITTYRSVDGIAANPGTDDG